MKLGIVAVYLPSEHSEALLKLHMEYFRRFTKREFTIYGGVQKCYGNWNQTLAQYPEIHQIELPPFSGDGIEHAYFLETLVAIALKSGVTHVLVTHLDAFPICPDWLEKLVAITDHTDQCVAAETYYTACLFFTREFYLEHAPTFCFTTLPADEQKVFCDTYYLLNHSGIAYLWTSFHKCGGFQLLQKEKRQCSITYGDYFGGILFHLGGAIRYSSYVSASPRDTVRPSTLSSPQAFFVETITRVRMLPSLYAVWRQVRKLIPLRLLAAYARWVRRQEGEYEGFSVKKERQALLQNPQVYLERLQKKLPMKNVIYEIRKKGEPLERRISFQQARSSSICAK